VTSITRSGTKKLDKPEPTALKSSPVKRGYISISGLRSTVAFLLVLWCAGTGCLAHGMAAGGAAPLKSNQSTSKTEMAMSGHACCKARHRALENKSPAGSQPVDDATIVTLPENSTPDGANSCCPLTSGSFVIASRSQTNDDHSPALNARVLNEHSLAEPCFVERVIPLHLPNHEHTYLTCCVFLI
jgi:hypothetical protein